MCALPEDSAPRRSTSLMEPSHWLALQSMRRPKKAMTISQLLTVAHPLQLPSRRDFHPGRWIIWDRAPRLDRSELRRNVHQQPHPSQQSLKPRRLLSVACALQMTTTPPTVTTFRSLSSQVSKRSVRKRKRGRGMPDTLASKPRMPSGQTRDAPMRKKSLVPVRGAIRLVPASSDLPVCEKPNRGG